MIVGAGKSRCCVRSDRDPGEPVVQVRLEGSLLHNSLLVIVSTFSFASWPSICLLWRNVCLGLLPIFQLCCLFVFVVELHELFVYIGDWALVYCIIGNDFLPFCGLSFFFSGFLCCALMNGLRGCGT